MEKLQHFVSNNLSRKNSPDYKWLDLRILKKLKKLTE